MKPFRLAAFDHSLSLRLLLFAGGMIAMALVAAWLVLGVLFERHAQRQLQTELEHHGVALIAALTLDAQQRPVLEHQPSDPRFSRPAGGLYWRVATAAHELRSRSLWDGRLPSLPDDASTGWLAFPAQGVFEERVLVVGRRVRLTADGLPVVVEVAADLSAVAAARAAFGQETAIFLLLLWIALASAAWMQVRLGLRPLRRVGSELDAMSRSIDARLNESAHPVEIQPLTHAINSFADRREQDVDRARQRARDLAHALKTPLTALRLQIDKLPPQAVQDMSHSLALLSGAVEGELARAGAVNEQQQVAVAEVVDRLFAVIKRTPDGSPLTFRNQLPQGLQVPLGMESALETFGALIENAARHASATVEVDGRQDAQGCVITIGDDGPGIPAELRGAALGRGVRLDQRGARHGLGLSIAQSFVESTGGELSLSDHALGGLCVRLHWPRAVH